jgi:ADP-heptose:LPS heptosyltransferase
MINRSRLLVVTLSNIGDLVLTTPVFEALAAHYPQARIDIVGDARSIGLLAAAPYAGELFARNKRAGLAAQWQLLTRLRARAYDLVVDLRTPFLAHLLRARQRLYKTRTSGAHAACEHFTALAPLGLGNTPPPSRIHLAPAATARAATLLSALPGERWLALAPGANWVGKRWPVEKFRALLEIVRMSYDAAVIVGWAADTSLGEQLRSDTLPTINLAGASDLPTAAAVLARAAAFVGNDSGLGHIAAAVGVPTLTLFGPGQPQRYRPWGPLATICCAPQGDLSQLTATAAGSALRELVPRARS